MDQVVCPPLWADRAPREQGMSQGNTPGRGMPGRVKDAEGNKPGRWVVSVERVAISTILETFMMETSQKQRGGREKEQRPLGTHSRHGTPTAPGYLKPRGPVSGKRHRGGFSEEGVGAKLLAGAGVASGEDVLDGGEQAMSPRTGRAVRGRRAGAWRGFGGEEEPGYGPADLVTESRGLWFLLRKEGHNCPPPGHLLPVFYHHRPPGSQGLWSVCRLPSARC